MKHNLKITWILISMFLITQLIGLYVTNVYAPKQVIDSTGQITNQTNLPYGFEPPQEVNPQETVVSILIALAIAVSLMLILMKLKAETFLRLWFFIVVILGISLGVNAFIIKIPYHEVISLAIAIPLAISKIFRRNVLVHNLTEILIYPGIASVFLPLLNLKVTLLLLVIISVYDMYAVWHAGFMQKMAKYQIEQVKVFSGFMIPYLGKKEKSKIKMQSKSKKNVKNVKVNLAILGGGDVVFPILLSGVVLRTIGLLPALSTIVGATLGLAYLFYRSEKGKFYPAMPFITIGCFIGLGIGYLLF